MSDGDRIVDGTKAMLVAQGTQAVLQGTLVLLLTRVFLDPDEYGLLFLALSVFGVALLFSNLGLAKSAGRYIAEYRERDPTQIPHVLESALKYNLLAIAAVATSFVLFGDSLAGLLGEPALVPFLAVGAGYIAVRSLSTFLSLTFQGFARITWSAAVGIVAHVSLFLAVVGFLLLGFGALGALYGYVVAFTMATVVGGLLLYSKCYAAYERAGAPEPDLSRRLLEYAAPLTVTQGANTIDSRTDIILVGYFMTPAAVGFYTLGKQITDFLIVPAASIGFSIAPTYGEQKAGDELARAAALYETAFEYTLALYVPATIGLFLIADPLVRLVFGPSYLGTVPVLQVLSLFVLVRAIDKITNDALDYLGRARARASAKGGLAFANVGLNVLLIPLWGIVGAAVATVLTYVVLVIVELYVISVELPIAPGRLLRSAVTTAGISGGMGLTVLVLVPHVSGFVTLAAVIVAGVTVWAALAVVSGILDVERLRAALI